MRSKILLSLSLLLNIFALGVSITAFNAANKDVAHINVQQIVNKFIAKNKTLDLSHADLEQRSKAFMQSLELGLEELNKHHKTILVSGAVVKGGVDYTKALEQRLLKDE